MLARLLLIASLGYIAFGQSSDLSTNEPALSQSVDQSISLPATKQGNAPVLDLAGCPYFQASPSTTLASSSLDSVPYEMLTARSKLDYIWSHLLVNQTTDAVNDPAGIFTESMQPTVSHVSDFIPKDRLKFSHSSGVVCKIKLEINRNSPYTGLLRTGSDYGVLRWSSTIDPALVGGPVPSMAVKFFKDGEPSANGVSLNVQVPQASSNPLALPLTNQFVAAPDAILQQFGTVTGYPNFTGNSDLARESLHSKIKTVHFPWQLIWVPNPRIQMMFPEHFNFSTNAEFYSQFLPPFFNMPRGEPVLFHLHAVDKPGKMSFYIGDLRMTSPFFRSDFGDKVLFFRHTITEEDIALRPEFGKICPVGRWEGCSPCPQTYDCINPDWAEQINKQSPYSEAYNPSRYPSNAYPSQRITDIFNMGTDGYIRKYGLNPSAAPVDIEGAPAPSPA